MRRPFPTLWFGARRKTIPSACRGAFAGTLGSGFAVKVLELGLDGCGRSSSPAQAAFVPRSMPVTRVVKAALEFPEVVADSLELAARVRVLPPLLSGGTASAGLAIQFSPWSPVGGTGRFAPVGRGRRATADWLLRFRGSEDFTVHGVRSPLPFPSHRSTDSSSERRQNRTGR